MPPEARRPGWPWIAALTGGLAATALAMALFRPPAPGIPAAHPAPSPAVTLAPRTAPMMSAEAAAMSAEAALFDPTPKFLPTKWNAAQKEAPRREPGRSLLPPYPPSWVFGGDELRLALPAPVSAPAGPAEALVAGRSSRSFLPLGRSEAVFAPPPARQALVEVFAAGTGRRVLALARDDADPPVPPGIWWDPPEFLAAVDAAGLTGPLVMTAGSGAKEVDDYFRRYLEETVRVGERLRPGFYRLAVGP